MSKIASTILGIATLFMSVLPDGAARASDVTLRVACYGGVYTAAQKKYVSSLFTARTGIDVEFIDGNPTDHLAKMIGAKGREAPFDVVYMDDDVERKAVAAGLVEKLDPSIVTNLQYLYDEAKSKDGYGPAVLFYSAGILYNVDKFKAAGIPAPVAWADLWDPRLVGHVVVPDIAFGGGRDMLITASRLAGGDESTFEKGIQKLAQLKSPSFPNSSATIEAMFRSGDLWVTTMSNGRAWGLIDSGQPLAYVLPKEGAVAHTAVIDLVRGSKHPKEAQAFINEALDPLAQLGVAHEVPYGPTNKLLASVLQAYPNLSKKFPASLDDVRQLYEPNWTLFNQNYPAAVELWHRTLVNQ